MNDPVLHDDALVACGRAAAYIDALKILLHHHPKGDVAGKHAAAAAKAISQCRRILNQYAAKLSKD